MIFVQTGDLYKPREFYLDPANILLQFFRQRQKNLWYRGIIMPRRWIVYGNHLITPSNVNRAIALAGNALRKHGMKPLQKPFMPLSLATAVAASFHRRNFRSPSFNPPP